MSFTHFYLITVDFWCYCFIRWVTTSMLGMELFNPICLKAKENRLDSFLSDVKSKSSVKNQQNYGSLSDTNLLYFGRWDTIDSQQYHSYWGGAYIRTMFTGTSLSIKLAFDTILVVSIDNEVPRGVNGKQGITDLTDRTLKEGTHYVIVGSAGQNYEISFQGFVLGSEAVTILPKQSPLIEFIGDSITAGTGPAKIPTVNYAWNTAVALGCDHTQIAFSGIALTTGFGCLRDKMGMDNQYFRLKNFNHLNDSPQADWNFSYVPDIIVINLGQNDQCGKEPLETFMDSMIKFVQKLRSHFPKIQIAILRPFGGPYADAIISAVNALNLGGNKRVHYIDTTGWLDKDDYSDGIHPNGVGGLKVVGNLVSLLRPLLCN